MRIKLMKLNSLTTLRKGIYAKDIETNPDSFKDEIRELSDAEVKQLCTEKPKLRG